MPYYPFEEAYFLEQARLVREAVDMPLILLGGINNLSTVQLALMKGLISLRSAEPYCESLIL
ncbi:MAG: hypothetical protein CM15mP49_23380 [Actinomycetota bacterium]|nr:MAG: hypothetical protein CM15mP49_23380 [Actinomycetota bacterium]